MIHSPFDQTGKGMEQQGVNQQLQEEKTLQVTAPIINCLKNGTYFRLIEFSEITNYSTININFN